MAERDKRAVALGRYIKEKRQDKGYKRPELIDEIDKLGVEITDNYIAKIEGGHRSLAKTGIDIREAWRMALGIDPETWSNDTGLAIPDYTAQVTLGSFNNIPQKLSVHETKVLQFDFGHNSFMPSSINVDSIPIGIKPENAHWMAKKPDIFVSPSLISRLENAISLWFDSSEPVEDGETYIVKDDND
ncbi:MAG: hypothetical protein AAF267_22935, partial [Deinococcota bacterium]